MLFRSPLLSLPIQSAATHRVPPTMASPRLLQTSPPPPAMASALSPPLPLIRSEEKRREEKRREEGGGSSEQEVPDEIRRRPAPSPQPRPCTSPLSLFRFVPHPSGDLSPPSHHTPPSTLLSPPPHPSPSLPDRAGRPWLSGLPRLVAAVRAPLSSHRPHQGPLPLGLRGSTAPRCRRLPTLADYIKAQRGSSSPAPASSARRWQPPPRVSGPLTHQTSVPPSIISQFLCVLKQGRLLVEMNPF